MKSQADLDQDRSQQLHRSEMDLWRPHLGPLRHSSPSCSCVSGSSVRGIAIVHAWLSSVHAACSVIVHLHDAWCVTCVAHPD